MEPIMQPEVSRPDVVKWREDNKLELEALLRDSTLAVKHSSVFDLPCDFKPSMDICDWLCSLQQNSWTIPNHVHR